ncbi:MAG: Lin1244/Lin1753 domain-containing protein [Candidatus Thorarchaeota archaeon]
MKPFSPFISHDCNSRNDEKMLEIRMEYNWEGYGLVWALYEKLSQATDYKLSEKSIKALSFEFGIKEEFFDAFLKKCYATKIFLKKNGFFYSKSLLKRINSRKEKSAKAKLAANKRWSKHRNYPENKEVTTYANALQTHCERIADAMQTQCDRNATAMQTQCDRNATAMPKQTNKQTDLLIENNNTNKVISNSINSSTKKSNIENPLTEEELLFFFNFTFNKKITKSDFEKIISGHDTDYVRNKLFGMKKYNKKNKIENPSGFLQNALLKNWVWE